MTDYYSLCGADGALQGNWQIGASSLGAKDGILLKPDMFIHIFSGSIPTQKIQFVQGWLLTLIEQFHCPSS